MMKQNIAHIAPYIAVGLFLLPIVLIIFFAILKSLKGKVTFELPRPYRYKPGEKVSGTVVIKPSKDLTADRIIVWLRCIQKDRSDVGTKTERGKTRGPRTITFFETSTVLTESVPLKGGFPTKYSFELELPQELEIPTMLMPENIPFGKAMNTMITIGTKYSLKTVRWELYAEVEMPGLDLDGRTPLNVDIQPKITNS